MPIASDTIDRSHSEELAAMRRELASERRRRAEVEQQRDVLQDELRRLICARAVERQIG